MLTSILSNPILKKQITNYSLNLEQMWKLWSLALGEKAHKRDQVADKVAVLRTVIFAINYHIYLFKTFLYSIFTNICY
jgi:fatty acid desaturase